MRPRCYKMKGLNLITKPGSKKTMFRIYLRSAGEVLVFLAYTQNSPLTIRAATSDFQQCGILTSTDSDEPV